MSGGHFDYNQSGITEMADAVTRLIRDNNRQDEDGYSSNYCQATLEKFSEAEKTLRLAAIMVQGIDWLVCGDDGEDSFHKRWDAEKQRLASTI